MRVPQAVRRVPHELGVGQRVRRGEVDRAGEVVVVDQPVTRPGRSRGRESRRRTAGHRRRAAQAAADQAQEHVEHAAAVRAHRHRRAQQHLARVRRIGLVGGRFPGAGHVDAEPPGVRGVRLVAAEDAGGLVVGGVVAVGVDRGGAGLQPDARRPCGPAAMASPTARVELTRESMMSRRFAAL